MQNPYLDLFLENFEHRKDSIFGWEYKLQGYPSHEPGCRCEECKERYRASLDKHLLREELVKKYAWAVPTEEAIDLIKVHSPHGVVEVGAGTGYWCWLLKQKGVKVYPIDRQPLHNHYVRGCWLPISKGTHRKLLRFDAETLLLCWPAYASSQASDALKFFKGNTLVYVGEGYGGCTGDDEFHDELNGGGWIEGKGHLARAKWEQVSKLDIPRFPGMNDRLYVYTRTG